VTGIVNDTGAFMQLVRAIQRFRPDIVHTHTTTARYRGQIAALFAGVRRRVHTERDACKPSVKLSERAASRVLFALAHRIIASFPEHARDITEKYRVAAAKIAVIPKGLPALPCSTAAQREGARAVLAVPQGHVAVLAAGWRESPANQVLSLHALAAIPRELRAKTLMAIVSPAVHDEFLRTLAAELDVRENVRLLSGEGELEAVLPAADILMLSGFAEGMPLQTVQAMFAGIAIVSTPWPGAESMLGNGLYGFIAENWEPEALATQLTRVLRSDGARAAIARRARSHAAVHYDIDRVAEAHCRLYRELCGAIA
jgi:glycosyltransferase involved in cell wall biosynthesis